jgi:hypothetical protein
MHPQWTTLKVFVIKVGLVFMISNFFTNKISQANNLSVVYFSLIWLYHGNEALALFIFYYYLKLKGKHCLTGIMFSPSVVDLSLISCGLH